MKTPAKLFSMCVVLILSLVTALPGFAQGRSVTVERRDGQFVIQPNGNVVAGETWQTRFNGGPFTYAFREIPLVGVNDITGWGVREAGRAYSPSTGGEPFTYEVVDTPSASRVTWYYPPTSDATRTFDLSYVLHGAVHRVTSGYELYWTFIEPDRGYPITASRVVVTLPADIPVEQIRATTYLDNEETYGARILDQRTIVFEGGPFPAQSVWEIRVQFPRLAAADDRCFDVPDISNCLGGRFKDFWETNGGLAVFGYPVSAALPTDTAEGTFLAQVLERNRFEYHPDKARPYDVLLGRLGVDRLVAQNRDWTTFPKAAPSASHFFVETGHAIAFDEFWNYWASHGLEFDGKAGTSLAESLALFGYPISEPQMETNTSGDTVLTQWFERARFEYHPDLPPGSRVLLGLLGNEVLADPSEP